MSTRIRRDDAIAAGITAALTGAFFVLPVFIWFPLTIGIVLAIAAKVGLR